MHKELEVTLVVLHYVVVNSSRPINILSRLYITIYRACSEGGSSLFAAVAYTLLILTKERIVKTMYLGNCSFASEGDGAASPQELLLLVLSYC